jgi:tyrosyl-tRNA synthetase
MPILEGTDGVQKMSKSLGNYIGVNEDAYEMFGKTMSITDELIIRYFELVTRVEQAEIDKMEKGMQEGVLNPRDVKMRLAREIITIYHNEEEAQKAQERFLLVFSKGDIPEDIPEAVVAEKEIWLPKFLQEQGMVDSTSDGRRMIKQGAVKLNGEKCLDENILIEDEMVIQVGKRKFVKVRK